jgi:hypothetical protein
MTRTAGVNDAIITVTSAAHASMAHRELTPTKAVSLVVRGRAPRPDRTITVQTG